MFYFFDRQLLQEIFKGRLKVDAKAMIRNRYNRIPHPALNTKREKNTTIVYYNLLNLTYCVSLMRTIFKVRVILIELEKKNTFFMWKRFEQIHNYFVNISKKKKLTSQNCLRKWRKLQTVTSVNAIKACRMYRSTVSGKT